MQFLFGLPNVVKVSGVLAGLEKVKLIIEFIDLVLVQRWQFKLLEDPVKVCRARKLLTL